MATKNSRKDNIYKNIKIDTKFAGKCVLVCGEVFTVVGSILPTAFDGYLLIARERSEVIHTDGETVPVDVRLIDIHNEEFQFYTEDVAKAHTRVEKQQNELRRLWSEFGTNRWLTDVRKVQPDLDRGAVNA